MVVAEQQQQSASSDETLRVDTDKIKPAIGKLQDLATRLQEAAHDLDTTSASYGEEPFGNDSTGKKLRGKYMGPHDQMIQAATQAGSVLQDATKQVDAMVKAFDATEQQSQDTGERLKLGMESGSDPGA